MSKQFYKETRLDLLPVNLRRVLNGPQWSRDYRSWLAENVACRYLWDDLMFIAPIPFCELANVTYKANCGSCSPVDMPYGEWCRACLRTGKSFGNT